MMAGSEDFSAKIADIKAQLGGMKTAVELTQKYPTDIDKSAKHERELSDAKRDGDRALADANERHQKAIADLTQKALDAALAAQKADAQKTEASISEKIVFIMLGINDLKTGLIRTDNQQVALVSQKAGASGLSASIFAVIATIVGISGMYLAFADRSIVQIPVVSQNAP